MKQFAAFGVKSPMPTLTRLRAPALLSLGLLLALAAGCSSDDHGPGRREGSAGQRRKPPTPLTGQEVFFDGKIGVAIKVGGPEGVGEMPGEPSAGKSGEADGGHRRGGGMSGGMGGGMRGGGGDRRHGGPSGDAGGDSGSRPEGPRPMMGSREPPLMIHLQFTNHGPERVTLNIVDFVSPLGNFAVQPEKLTLDPGQSTETEPMSSRLTDSLTEAEATLELQLAGQTEKKVVVLRAVHGDVPPGEPAAQPGK